MSILTLIEIHNYKDLEENSFNKELKLIGLILESEI